MKLSKWQKWAISQLFGSRTGKLVIAALEGPIGQLLVLLVKAIQEKASFSVEAVTRRTPPPEVGIAFRNHGAIEEEWERVEESARRSLIELKKVGLS